MALDFSDLLFERDSKDTLKPSTTGALGRAAIRSAVPTAAGIAAFMPGFLAGAAVGGPFAPITGIAGGLATSMGAGYLAGEAQDSILKSNPALAEKLGQDPYTQMRDVSEHPYASFVGELAPQALAFRPSVSGLKSLRGVTDETQRAAIIGDRLNMGMGAAIGGGQEAVEQYRHDEMDPYKLLLATGAGALLNKETFIGRPLNAAGEAITPNFVARQANKNLGLDVQPVSNVDETNMLAPRLDQAAPVGTQGELFTAEQAPATASPYDPFAKSQRVEPEQFGQQPDLFSTAPGSETRSRVATDFRMDNVLMRLRAANPDENGALGRADAFTLKLSNRLSDALVKGNDLAIENILQTEMQKLETGNLKPETIDYRKNILDAAQQTVADYRANLTRDFAEEARTRQSNGETQGVQFDNTVQHDLLGAEQQAREQNAAAQLAEQRAQQQAQFEQQLAQANQVTADARAQEAKQRRLDLLQSVLDDPATRNPIGRFISSLRKEGFRDTSVHPDEAATLSKFEDARQAFTQPDVIPTGPNEGGDFGIKAAAPAQQPAPAKPAANPERNKYRPEGFRLESPPSTPEDFARLEAAQARRARKAEPDVTPEATPAVDRSQGELFKANGEPTKQAMGQTVRQLINEANRMLEKIKGAKGKEMMKEAIDAFVAKDVDMSFVRETERLIKSRKFAEARRNLDTLKEQTNAAAEKPVQESVRKQPESRVESGQAAEAGGSDRVQRSEKVSKQDVQRIEKVIETAADRGHIDYADELRLKDMLKKGDVEGVQAELAGAARRDGEVAPRASKEAKDAANKQAEKDINDALRSENEPDVFRATDKTTGEALPADQIKSIADELTSNWKGLDVKVVKMDDLPREWQQMMRERGAEGATGFLTKDGKGLFLIADNIKSAETARATIFHEGLGHYGLRQKFQARLDKVLEDIYHSNDAVKRDANTWLKDHPEEHTGSDKYARAVEEVLAGRQETGGVPASVFARIGQVVKDFLRQMGLNLKYTDRDIDAILHQAAGEVTSTGNAAGSDVMFRNSKGNIGSPAFTKDLAQDFKINSSGKVRRFTLKSLTMRQLVEQYGDTLANLKPYTDTLFSMGTKTNHLTQVAHDLHERWTKLKGTEGHDVGELLLDSTFRQIDPREEFAKGRNEHLVAEDQENFDELSRRYNKMSPDAKKVFSDVLGYFDDMLKQKRDLFEKMIDSMEGMSDADRAASKEDIDRYFKNIKVYFPLMRNGDFIVIARSNAHILAEEKLANAIEHLRDISENGTPEEISKARDAVKEARSEIDASKEEQGYSVQAFDTEAEMKRVAAQLKEQGMNVKERLASDFSPGIDGVSTKFIDTINRSLDLYGSKNADDRKVAEGLKALVNQVYLKTLPENSALKRSLKREYVPGFSRDSQRVFAKAAIRDAFYLARLEFGQQARDLLDKLRVEAHGSDLKAQEVFEEIKNRHANSLKYVETPIQDTLGNISYMWFLGATPSFAVMNSMQMPMVTMPMLAARHGLGRSSSELVKALAEVAKAQTEAFRQGGWQAEVDPAKLTKDVGEQKMIQALLDKGIIDMTQGHDLGTIATGGNTKWRTMMQVASWFPHYTEKTNRLATALAAYRLSKGQGEQRATDFAEKMVADSHFDYSRENAPHWMQPGVIPGGKLIFQFKKYQQAMAYAFINNFKEGFLSKKPEGMSEKDWAEHRSIARRTFAGLMLSHGLVAGTLGLPGASLVTGAANLMHKAFGDNDEPWDAEVAYRKFLVDVFTGGNDDAEAAKAIGEVISKGIFRLPGLKDVMPGDVAARVGAGDLFTPLQPRISGAKGRDAFNEYAAALLGPIGSIGGDMFEAFKYYHQGDYAKGAEYMMPKVIRDMARSYRFGTEGVTTSKGNPVVHADDISVPELVAQFFGMTPARIGENYEEKSAIENAKAELADRRQILLRHFAEAQLKGDLDAVTKARDDIQAYNEKRRADGTPSEFITASSMQKALVSRRRYDMLLKNGVSLKPRDQRMRDLYGNFGNTD